MTDAVSFKAVSRHFGEIKAVDQVDLQVVEGEFFGLLGPSGSGKTTCLRLIAGFEQPSSGEIAIFGERSEHTPPYRRKVATVFQDYALFPHMTVLDNVAYGLRVRGVAKAERHAAARETLALVRLGGFDLRKPAQLSGGQRQRVALARALVTRPRVLLLDEPLGALDLKLREQMQTELKALQRRLCVTFVFVTHDQGEALSMSDRVAVFDHGKVMQIGTPVDIYERPSTPFVAEFVGGSNVIEAALARTLGLTAGTWSLRPEKIAILPEAAETNDRIALPAVIESVSYQGASLRYICAAGDSRLTVVQPAETDCHHAAGDRVTLCWRTAAMHRMTS
jgi:putative spermidine/putrescine transport system ATP-binding protein